MDRSAAIIEKMKKIAEDYADWLTGTLESSLEQAGIKKLPQDFIHDEIFNSFDTAKDRYIKFFDTMVVGRYPNDIKKYQDEWFAQEKDFKYGALGFILDVYNIDHLAYKTSQLSNYKEYNDDYKKIITMLALFFIETLEKKGYPYLFILGSYIAYVPFHHPLIEKDFNSWLRIYITNYFAFFKYKFDN